MSTYQRFCLGERKELSRGLARGISLRAIVDRLG